MNLTFKAGEILERGKGLTFDDVLLMPNHSEISSRKTPDLTSRVTRNWTLETPVIAANMDTISESQMCIKMAELGGLAILHRFLPEEDQAAQVREIRDYFSTNNIKSPIAASIGVKDEGMRRADMLVEAGADILTIDIAHGDSVMLLEVLNYVKKKFPKIDVIAGNTATADGVRRMIENGADAVKVGIGPGSMCTTRIITGCGVPQLTAVALAVQEADKHGIPVIADGGIKSSGDIVKAFSAGASTCMLGSMLAGTLETPGEVQGGMKRYRGMASKEAQVSWRGDLPQGMAAEGEATAIPCKGSAGNVVHEISGGIRSGMTYLNAATIAQMRDNAYFIEMSTSGMAESRPHGVR